MKKGGSLLLLSFTVAFSGFILGMFFGRNFIQETPIIQHPTNPTSTLSQTGTVQAPELTGYRININTASAQTLDTLPGIGTILAQRIVDYRQTNGPFKQTSDLSKVDGIGSEKLLAILDLITVEE